MTETIIVHLEVILVEEFVRAGRAVALHRAEVLTPARASCILFQSLLFGASASGRWAMKSVIDTV